MARVVGGLAAVCVLAAGWTAGAPAHVGAESACAVSTVLPAPPSDRPHQALTIRLAPDLTSAAGTLTVSFAPPAATDRLVFRLWPN